MSGEWNTTNNLYPGAFLQNAMQQWRQRSRPSCERAVGTWPTALFLISEVTEYLYVPLGQPYHQNRDVQAYTLVTRCSPTSSFITFKHFITLVQGSREEKQKKNNLMDEERIFFLPPSKIVIFFLSKEKTDQQTVHSVNDVLFGD